MNCNAGQTTWIFQKKGKGINNNNVIIVTAIEMYL